MSTNGRLSLAFYVFRALKAWIDNVHLLGRVAAQGEFDAIVLLDRGWEAVADQVLAWLEERGS